MIEDARDALQRAYMVLDLADPKDGDLLDAAILDVQVARLRLNHAIREAKECEMSRL